MDVCWITSRGVESRSTDELPQLLQRNDGFVWADLATCDAEGRALLEDVFRCHPLAVRDCLDRNFAPKLHPYPDSVFLIVHAPLAGELGQVHLLELDQFVSRHFLITVHGPLGAGVALESALQETRLVRERLEAGRLQPKTPAELSHAIVSAIAHRQEDYVSLLAARVATLERQVLGGTPIDTEETLEELFRIRHELLTVRTMSAASREVYARMTGIARFLPEDSRVYVEDLVDRFDRVRSLCDGEKEFLQGILDYHQSRTATKMNLAMERLALITAVALPVTAIAGIYGMNVIVSDGTRPAHLAAVVAVMLTVSGVMLRYARRQGWW